MATKTNNLWVAYGDPKMWVGNLDERPCSNLKFNLSVWADGIGVCTVRDLRQQHTTQVQLTPQAPDPVSKQKYEVWADTDAIISLDHPYYKEHKYEFDKKLNVITNEQYLEALGLIDFAFTIPSDPAPCWLFFPTHLILPNPTLEQFQAAVLAPSGGPVHASQCRDDCFQEPLDGHHHLEALHWRAVHGRLHQGSDQGGRSANPRFPLRGSGLHDGQG